MKADLYTAAAQTQGASGLAHRTAAGFVVLTSADGDDIIALIDDKQSQSDLIDQIVAHLHAASPDAFAMLFTAGGDLYVIASGAAEVSIESASNLAVLRPVSGQVLVQAVAAGINETAATIVLSSTASDPDTTTSVLTAGTVHASKLSLAVGDAVLPAPTNTQFEEAVAEIEVDEPAIEEPVPEIEVDEPAIEEVSAEEPAPAATEPEIEVGPEPEAVAAAVAAVAVAAPQLGTQIDDATQVEPSTAPVASEPVASEPALAAEPAPTPIFETTDEPHESTPVGPVMVLGVACTQGHHNHPDAVYCSQCGTKMGVHHTTVLLNGPRPPLGVLVVDDGTTYSLSEDLVIGREPTSHNEVIAGRAQPMILTDDTLSLSRKHAHIWLDDWTVFVQDLGSSNGTYLSRPGQNEPWFKLDSSQSTALEPGDRLRVGGRIIQVELHHVR